MALPAASAHVPVGMPTRHVQVPKAVSLPPLIALLRLAEVGAILAGGAMAFGLFAAKSNASTYALLTVLGALIAANFLSLSGSYRLLALRRAWDSLRCMLVSWLGASVAVGAIAIASDVMAPPVMVWLAIWAALAAAALGVIRIVISRQIYNWEMGGRLGRTVVVYGCNSLGRTVLERMTGQSRPDTRVCAVFDDAPTRPTGRYVGIPFLGDLDALADFVRQNPVNTVVVALPMSAHERLNRVLERLCLLPVDVLLYVDSVRLQKSPLATELIGEVPLLRVIDRPLADTRLLLKGIEDRVLGSLILLAILPLMALIALAIKLDSAGPVFFRQRRYGFNDRLIEVLKFRTMYHDCTDADAEKLTQRNDQRVTKIGTFVRRTSLDELPQFINVVCGEMSIVGPRPHACRAKAGGILYQDAVPNYSARHRVKPGITGLAQIKGWRGETETVEQIRKRVENDLAYIENWSLWLDMKIICLTLLTGFVSKKAY